MATSLGNNAFVDDLTCKICLEILENPMQCQFNEHYFCRKCIANHLENSSTCPMCQDELTMETLRSAPRVVVSIVSQLKKPRCNHVDRGCREDVKLEDLPFHHKVCGFAPVACSNEGCTETVNRQERDSHERETCPFRKTRCEDCREEMAHREYEMHRCFLRKEMNEMKMCLAEVTVQLKVIKDELKAHGEYIKNLQDPLRSASSYVVRQERRIILNGQIVVAGGHTPATSQSFEVFNWSTKSWTLFEEKLLFKRHHSFSFAYPCRNKVMICGGQHSKRCEYLDMNKNPPSSISLPACLSNDRGGKGALCGNRVFTFDDNVRELVLKSPYSVATVRKGPWCLREYYGVECFDKTIVVVGGSTKQYVLHEYRTSSLNSVFTFDTTSCEIKDLAPLPYKASKMATVRYQDSIIIIGGETENGRPLNGALMYNIKTEECEKLPPMLRGRSGCAAVIMEDVIVVMGGWSKDDRGRNRALNMVEYYVMGQDRWNELPPMHLAREGVTACVSL